jgi:hypothetical protein
MRFTHVCVKYMLLYVITLGMCECVHVHTVRHLKYDVLEKNVSHH